MIKQGVNINQISKKDSEKKRVKALHDYKILDSLPDEEFDNLATLAAEIAGTKISQVNLIDQNRQWTKAISGLNPEDKSFPRDKSVCQYTIESEDITEIKDLKSDSRFADFDYVKAIDGFRYYLGIPLVSPDGYAIGSLCVIDYDEKHVTDKQIQQLKIIAKQVMTHLELHKQNRELKALNDYKVKLMKMLSHDMRSPLNGIIGLSGMLKEMNITENPDHLELLEIIEQSSTQLNHMIDEVMSYTIIESDGLKLEKEETDLEKSVADISKLYQPTARIKKIDLDFYTENLGETVLMDGDKFEQILGNLLSNAIKYTKEGGSVKLSLVRKTSVNRDVLELVVADTGVGIKSDDLEDILSDASLTVSEEGTNGEKSSGIGLTIVKHFVDLFSGELNIESSVNEGSRFTVKIPL